ncbi:MAG: hypothetical protein ACTSYB_02810 [Candidatus Helarchaeota archaeon]
MISNKLDLKELIRARLARTKMYLQQYIKELPNYLSPLRHSFEHILSKIHILIQQLSPELKLNDLQFYTSPPKGGIPDEIDYFDLALNEIKTAFLYFKQRKVENIFKEISDYYLEQKISKIIQELEKLRCQIKKL